MLGVGYDPRVCWGAAGQAAGRVGLDCLVLELILNPNLGPSQCFPQWWVIVPH